MRVSVFASGASAWDGLPLNRMPQQVIALHVSPDSRTCRALNSRADSVSLLSGCCEMHSRE